MLLLAGCLSAIPIAQAQSGAAVTAPRGVEIQAELAEGLPIGLVYVHLVAAPADPQRAAALQQEVAAAFGVRAGATYRQVVAGLALNRVRRLESVGAVQLRLFNTVPSGQVAVALLVTPRDETPAGSGAPAAETRRFPTIHEDERSRFVYILNGGSGVFSDTDPWFGGYGEAFNAGNPTALDPLGAGTATWAEAYLEPGIGGITRVAEWPVYVYGAASYLVSGTAGPDVYNPGSFAYGDFEKLYAGFIWDLPATGAAVDVSVGKQVYQLRDGFLLSKIPVSTSIGERAALYLGPRLTSENTVLVRAKAGRFGMDAFAIEPSEVDVVATDTKLEGVDLRYQFGSTTAAFTYFYVPESKSTFRTPGGGRLPRAGLRTYNPSVSAKKLFGREGAWLKAEYAHQDHEDFEMSADAGYVWAGYQMTATRWKPSFSYRWSYFSGDDPATQTFERFDPLFSGGLGNFLPGIVFSKAYKNSNLVTNRATFSVKPSDQLELIVDYFHHRADVTNNLGGIGPLQTLESRDIGQEVTLTAYCYVGRNLFLQGIASAGMPGEALDRALGADVKTWYTVQAALYVFF